MKRLKIMLQQAEAQVVLFALVGLFLNRPLLNLFDRWAPHGPFAYFFILWALLIVLLWAVSMSLRAASSTENAQDGKASYD